MDDEWTLPEARSPEEMATLRSDANERRCSEGEAPIEAYTCDKCERANVCLLAFDWYNTQGDCLWIK